MFQKKAVSIDVHLNLNNHWILASNYWSIHLTFILAIIIKVPSILNWWQWARSHQKLAIPEGDACEIRKNEKWLLRVNEELQILKNIKRSKLKLIVYKPQGYHNYTCI